MKTIELSDLVGDRVLTGVDETRVEERKGSNRWIDAAAIRFTLDSITYMATEDPDDGYRSALREIVQTDEPTKNGFAPVAVRCEMADPGRYGDKILNIIAKHNGLIVLQVGTSAIDDYYPSFVASFNPGAMQ